MVSKTVYSARDQEILYYGQSFFIILYQWLLMIYRKIVRQPEKKEVRLALFLRCCYMLPLLYFVFSSYQPISCNGRLSMAIQCRDIVAEELWSKQVFWTLVAEWFGYYEDMVKLPNDCWDVDYRIFESAKDFAKWCICIANADQNLSYYVKHVLFKLRANPQPSDRVLHGQIQKKIQEALEWGKKHLTLPNLTLELTGKIEQYLAGLLEQSADGMSIAEERRIFNTAC